MLKQIYLSWKNKLLVLLLIMVGYILCITIISMMANQIVLDIKIHDNINMGNSDKRSILSILSDYNTDFDGDPIDVIREVSNYGKVDVLRLGTDNISSDGYSAEAQICPVLFHQNTDWTPLLAEGRYFSPEECSNGSSNILVGKNVASKLKVGIGSNVDFYGKEFEVIGILGPKYVKDQWDDVVSISLKALPDGYNKKLRNTLVDSSTSNKMLKLQMVLRINNDKLAEVSDKITTLFKSCKLKIDKIDHSDWRYSSASDIMATVLVLIPIMVVAVFNVVNISFFWIMDRKREITIKKALGANNKFIIATVRKEMMTIGLLSAVLSLILQGTCVSIFETKLNKAGLSLQISWVTFVVGVAVALFLGYIASILPTEKIVNMEPAEALRYE